MLALHDFKASIQDKSELEVASELMKLRMQLKECRAFRSEGESVLSLVSFASELNPL